MPLTVDLPYLTSIYPAISEYISRKSIGRAVERGCPVCCAFCLYPYIEGKRVRFRPAAMVVKDISQHYHEWGPGVSLVYRPQFITRKEAYPNARGS